MVHGSHKSQLDTWSEQVASPAIITYRQSHQGVCTEESVLLDIQLANPPFHEEHLFCTPVYAPFSFNAWTALNLSAHLVLAGSREFFSCFSPPLLGPKDRRTFGPEDPGAHVSI
jgi:hypothetical protein